MQASTVRSGLAVTDPFVEAIHRGRLYDVAREVGLDPEASPDLRVRAHAASIACEEIGRACEAERRRLVTLLRSEGCDVDGGGEIGPRQNHTVELGVAGYEAARRAADLLRYDGYEPWQQWERGAERSASRFSDEFVVGATADVTTVVRLRWGSGASRSRMRRVFTPTPADWSLVELPGALWPLYSIVRPVRLGLERVGFVERHAESLGPFLSTPESLIDPLLEFGRVGADDCVLDIGCGDGRVVVEAAERTGCRAIGVERSAALVARARERADERGVGDLVEIVHGDGRAADFDEATLVFMFLSVRVAGDLVPAALQRLRPSARLVIHEQSRLPPLMRPVPEESRALIAPGAVTVAHRWTAP